MNNSNQNSKQKIQDEPLELISNNNTNRPLNERDILFQQSPDNLIQNFSIKSLNQDQLKEPQQKILLESNGTTYSQIQKSNYSEYIKNSIDTISQYTPKQVEYGECYEFDDFEESRQKYQKQKRNKALKSLFIREQLIEKLEKENMLIQQQKKKAKEKQQLLLQEENKSNELRQFIQKLKLKTFLLTNAKDLEIRRFEMLNSQHYGLLNEYFPERLFLINGEKISKKAGIIKNIKIFCKKPKLVPLIQILPKYHPDGKLSNFIDICTTLFTLTLLLLMNFNIFFQFDFFDHFLYEIFILLLIFFFIIEMIARVNIGITKEGKVYFDTQLILQHYKQTYMKADLTCIIILIISAIRKTIQKYNYFIQDNLYYFDVTLLILSCVKFKSVKYTIRTLEHRIIMSGFQNHFLVLIKMLFQIITMSHFISCIWYILQVIEIRAWGESNTWIQYYGFIEQEWYEAYMQCYYWSTATIMLIGTKGETTVEVLFSTIILFFTVGIFAYILENVAQTFNQINKDSVQYKADLETLNHYMKNKNLEWETQIKVRQQLELCYKSSQEINVNKKAVEVLQQLPDNLSNNIRKQINDALIRCFIPLCKNFSEKTLKLTYQNPQIMQETSYVTQEKIFTQNENQEISLYLVLAGQVDIYYAKQSTDTEQSIHHIKTLKEGDLFCVENFFSGTVPEYSAIATKFSNICKIKRSGFLQNLKYNQQEYERFIYIKDQLIQRGFSPYFNRPCQICNRKTHFEIKCNLLQYLPNRYRIYLKERERKKQLQPRQRYYRENQKGFSVYNYIDTYVLINQHFQNKYPDESFQNTAQSIEYIKKMYDQDIVFSEDEYNSRSDEDDYFEDESHNNIGQQQPQEQTQNQLQVQNTMKERKSKEIIMEQDEEEEQEQDENQQKIRKKINSFNTEDKVSIRPRNVTNQSKNIKQQGESQGFLNNLINKVGSEENNDLLLQDNKRTGQKKQSILKPISIQENSQENIINKIFEKKLHKLLQKEISQAFSNLGQQQQQIIQNTRNGSIQNNNNLKTFLYQSPQRDSSRQSDIFSNQKSQLFQNTKQIFGTQDYLTQNTQNLQITGGTQYRNMSFMSDQNQQDQREEDLFISFDKQQNFEFYYPRYNLDNLLDIYHIKMQQISLQRQKEQQQLNIQNKKNKNGKNYSNKKSLKYFNENSSCKIKSTKKVTGIQLSQQQQKQRTSIMVKQESSVGLKNTKINKQIYDSIKKISTGSIKNEQDS